MTARADFLDIEKRWLNLARSYEFAERLNLVARESDRRRGGRTRQA